MSSTACFIINNVARPNIDDSSRAFLLFSQQGMKRTANHLHEHLPPPVSKLIKYSDKEKGLFVALMSFQFSVMLYGVSYFTALPRDLLPKVTEALFNTVFSFKDAKGQQIYTESDLDFFRNYFSKYIAEIHESRLNPESEIFGPGGLLLDDIIDIYGLEKNVLSSECSALLASLFNAEILTLSEIFKPGAVEWSE